MLIHGNANRSQLANCLAAAPKFLLPEEQSLAIMRRQINTIAELFPKVCREAAMPEIEQRHLWRWQFLNDLAFEGLQTPLNSALQPLNAQDKTYRAARTAPET